MNPAVSVGNQSFKYMREHGSFYIDKTGFIKEWWEHDDMVTLITRPRRFGKTLNLSMMECFFSTVYANRGDLFEGLSVWDDEAYRQMQGTYPVIKLSFAGVKSGNYRGAKNGIVKAIADAYEAHRYLKDSDVLSADERQDYDGLQKYADTPSADKKIDEQFVAAAVNRLSMYLERYYNRKVMIFLDEYDTPLHEAYVSGYWKELVAFIREFFNWTFKTNDYLFRGLLTGITRVSKESVFSDLNNLKVVTTTTDRYSTAFGFTKEEVFQALEERGLAGEMGSIRFWYDGFVFGGQEGIYNPWSITMFLDTGEYGAHWADTSSNALVSELIRTGSPELKMQMEDLLAGRCLEIEMDEQVIFEQLKKKRGAIWSLLTAGGYLKARERIFDREKSRFVYKLEVTNHEVEIMFQDMIAGWFPEDETSYGNFKEALMIGDLDYMNQYINEVAQEMFGSFDGGKEPSERKQPERFYHGFVLGLIVDLGGRYHIRSNRESGLGRYDVMMEPVHEKDDGIVMEFKVFSKKKDGTLEKAVENALLQIEERNYDKELVARGIPRERIRHYGFVFNGKEVLIGQR